MPNLDGEVWRNWSAAAPAELLDYFLPEEQERFRDGRGKLHSMEDLRELLRAGCRVTITIEPESEF